MCNVDGSVSEVVDATVLGSRDALGLEDVEVTVGLEVVKVEDGVDLVGLLVVEGTAVRAVELKNGVVGKPVVGLIAAVEWVGVAVKLIGECTVWRLASANVFSTIK